MFTLRPIRAFSRAISCAEQAQYRVPGLPQCDRWSPRNTRAIRQLVGCDHDENWVGQPAWSAYRCGRQSVSVWSLSQLIIFRLQGLRATPQPGTCRAVGYPCDVRPLPKKTRASYYRLGRYLSFPSPVSIEMDDWTIKRRLSLVAISAWLAVVCAKALAQLAAWGSGC